MDNIELDTFFFYCPARLLWQNWENFNGAHVSAGAQDTTYTIPVLATGVTVDHDPAGGVGVDNLAAYMGVPHGLQTAQVNVNSLPFRMYNFVYDEWFRDQNVTDEKTFSVGDGPDGLGALTLRKSAKKHDYFTSALPYLQKGDVGVLAQAVFTDSATSADITIWSTDAGNYQHIDGTANPAHVDTAAGTSAERLYTEIDINALRQSVAIQRLLERDARGGTRYTEIIKAHFGVTSPDFRLQRPEYLGGGKALINVAPVANTSGVDSTVSISGADEPQGELRGVGTGVIRGHGWAKSFTEHGYILGLIRARGDITYFQGLDRLWSRSTRYDFYLPVLANLGEQSILNKELYISNSSATDDAVFGYQERWAEYRTKMSRLVGNFNPDVSGALSHWHLAEDFSSLPSLNTTFIEDQTPMSRITTVDTEEDFLLDVWFNYKCARPMPVYSVPSLTGRF